MPADNQIFGYDANDAAIGVEYCYGGSIAADLAYEKYVWVMAYACSVHGLDPRTAITGHFFLDPKRKTDPVTGLAQSRRTYDQLLRDVVAEFTACGGVVPTTTVLPASGSLTTAARANVRRGEPNTRVTIHQVLPAGTPFAYVSIVEDGESVNGNSRWLKNQEGNYLWSGATMR